MDAPPSLEGAVQERSIWVRPEAVALSPVGASGTDGASVVALVAVTPVGGPGFCANASTGEMNMIRSSKLKLPSLLEKWGGND